MSTQTLVKNREKLERPIIYDGLLSGKISPTDIDACFELFNKFLILFEIKEQGKDITIGQKITTTRIIDAWNSDPNKLGIIIFAQHNPQDNEIMLKDCIVNKIYMNGEWKNLSKKVDVKTFLITLGNKFNINPFKNFDV